MKKRILSIITSLALVLPMMCGFNIVKPQTAQAYTYPSYFSTVAYVNGVEYKSFQRAWVAAVKCGGTFKLNDDWRPYNKRFDVNPDVRDDYSDIEDYDDYFDEGALCVPEGMSVTIDLNGKYLSRNLYYSDAVSDGRVIMLERDARLTITDTSDAKNGCIAGGNTIDDGGGIYAGRGSRIYMYAGQIARCKAVEYPFCYADGGAVYLKSGAMMYMYGGKLTENETVGYARNPYSDRRGAHGGAVYVEKDARFYMLGGEISHNTTYHKGGAIYGDGGSDIFLRGGIIRDNNGETSVIHALGKLELNGTEVAYNTTDITQSDIDGCPRYIIYASKGAFIGGSVHDNTTYGSYAIYGTTEEEDFFSYYMYFGGDIQVYNNYDSKYEKFTNVAPGICCGDMSSKDYIGLNIPLREGAMIGCYPNLKAITQTKGRCRTSDSNPYNEKYFFSDRKDMRIAIDLENENVGYVSDDTDWGYLAHVQTNLDTDTPSPDSFISKITAVKNAAGKELEYTVDTNPNSTEGDADYYTVQNNITIHVPNTTDIDLTNLAVEFETSGTLSSTPVVSEKKSGSYADFTKPVTYTLVNQDDRGHDDGGARQNRRITIVNDLNVPTYTLKVESGTGSGTYTAGSEVSVSADDVENMRFKEWTASGVELTEEQKTSRSMTFTMPENAVNLTATYLDLTTWVEITLDEPYGGKPLDDSVTIAVSNGTPGEVPVAWSPASGTADFETTYNAVITLVSENGFSNNLSIKLNEQTLTTDDIKKPDSKTLVITKAYTTEPAKLLSVPTAELTAPHGTAMEDILAQLD
ncbi:MAG: hypothetical protein ACI4EA_05085, partial [Candidatus Ornithomonoglobus sp.]